MTQKGLINGSEKLVQAVILINIKVMLKLILLNIY